MRQAPAGRIRGTRQDTDNALGTLAVDKHANKIDIRHAVQTLFKVKVLSVNTLNVRGKNRRERTAQFGKTPDWKKAIVTLKEGDKIQLV